jgi:hypothetical protein
MRTRAVLLVVILAAACACASSRDASPSTVSLPRPALNQPPGFRSPPGAYLAERNRCIDRELAARKLNPLGDPEGTTYPPDSPLLRLTETADRYEYVMERRRDIATACTRAAGEPEP